MPGKQRISYFPLEKMDADMRAEMERCRREGTPRPESSAVRGHVKAAFWSFANSWRDLFHRGVCEHAIKELCRLYVSRSVQCDYCGNQRSIKAAGAGVIEDHVKDLLNFEKSTRYNDREKAALAYAEAITWHLDTDDAFWQRLHRHFSEAELAAPLEHRPSPGARRDERVDGAGVRNGRRSAPVQVFDGLLGAEQVNAQ